MNSRLRITSIRFYNYKAFKEYSVSLTEFNVLVGPNNAGKSTVLGALRILSEGIRRARHKSPVLVDGPKERKVWGYPINLEGLPVSTENVFHNYEDSEPATVDFRLSNGSSLKLFFPSKEVCYLICDAERYIKTPSVFRKEFDLEIVLVPILGPVEHNEPLFLKEAARTALLSHRASRNFRNIWHHFNEGFDEFRKTIQETWPGMDIQPPELIPRENKTILCMFCPEERFPREIFWAGFGFQVWCQMLTFILQAKEASLLVIDEPDIYLHSDLQRQLVGLLKELGPAIIIATHSAEIITEVEPQSLLNVNKRFQSARRIKDVHELQQIFSALGSNLNPTLTQLAKTRRVVFVEGKDFQILSRFARRLGLEAAANRADFAIVQVEGYNPTRVRDLATGMEKTLGEKLLKIVIFDRDYRSEEEAAYITGELKKFCWHAVVHSRKELENFLLVPSVLERAIAKNIKERGEAATDCPEFTESIQHRLMTLSKDMKAAVFSRILDGSQKFKRSIRDSEHNVTIFETGLNEIDAKWGIFEERMKLVGGKDLFSELNGYLQKTYRVNLSIRSVADSFKRPEMCPEIVELLMKLDEARKAPLP